MGRMRMQYRVIIKKSEIQILKHGPAMTFVNVM